MSVKFNEIGSLVATFATSTALVGDVVALASAGTVAKATSSDTICGLAVSKGNGVVGVQIKGAMTFSCTDSNMTLGRVVLAAAGSNKVKVSADGSGVPALVVEIDTTAHTVTAIL